MFNTGKTYTMKDGSTGSFDAVLNGVPAGTKLFCAEMECNCGAEVNVVFDVDQCIKAVELGHYEHWLLLADDMEMKEYEVGVDIGFPSGTDHDAIQAVLDAVSGVIKDWMHEEMKGDGAVPRTMAAADAKILGYFSEKS